MDYSDFFDSLSDGSVEEESLLPDDHAGAKAVEQKIATTPHDGADLSDFDSLCDGSVEEESLLPDDQTKWKGTTTVAVIGGDAIYIAADGRGCSSLENEDGLIVDGNMKKIVKISDKIVITIAGRSEILAEIVEIATKSVVGGSMISMMESFKKFRKSWRKENGQKEFQASILICGWSRGKKTIIKVDAYDTEMVDEINSCLASGWGEEAAEDTVRSMVQGQDVFSSEKYLESVSQAITVSAMGANYTGGRVMTCIVDSKRVKFQKRKHVMELLYIHYDKIGKNLKLTQKLVCMTVGLKYSYQGEIEVQDYLRQKFGHPTVDIIGVRFRGNVIIRFMTFSDVNEAEHAFVSVAGKKNMGRVELSRTAGTVKYNMVLLKPLRKLINELQKKYWALDF